MVSNANSTVLLAALMKTPVPQKGDPIANPHSPTPNPGSIRVAEDAVKLGLTALGVTETARGDTLITVHGRASPGPLRMGFENAF